MTVYQPPISTFSVVHNPATATQATISHTTETESTSPASNNSKSYSIVTAVTASIAAGATAQTPVHAYLRDGASGSGTIVWSATLAAPADGSSIVAQNGLNIKCTSGTVTLEFDGAGVTASAESVSMQGYDVNYGGV